MGKCFFVTLACNKLFSTLGTEFIIQREHEKQFRNQNLRKKIFTLPGLESEIWQEIRLRPSIHTTCQNLKLKKPRVIIVFEFNFLQLVKFLFVCSFSISYSEELFSRKLGFLCGIFSKKTDSEQNFFCKKNVLTQLTP